MPAGAVSKGWKVLTGRAAPDNSSNARHPAYAAPGAVRPSFHRGLLQDFFVKDFLSKTPHYVYGTLQRFSVKDSKTQPTQWRLGEFGTIRRGPSKSRLHAGT